MTVSQSLGALVRYLRADVCGMSANALAEATGVTSGELLRREQGELGGPSRQVLVVLTGIRARLGIQGAVDAWSVEELVDLAKTTAERARPVGRAA